MTAPHELVDAEIQAVRNGSSRNLDLSEAYLEQIPEEVFTLSTLESLNVASNGIRVVPERIRELQNLKRIHLGDNPLEQVPDIPGLILDWDAYLRCRETLSPEHVLGLVLYAEKVGEAGEIIAALTSLSGLRELYFGRQEFFLGKIWLGAEPPNQSEQYILDALGTLRNLQTLSLWKMRLDQVPPGIRELRRIEALALREIMFEGLPDWLFELPALRYLDVEGNALKSVPAAVERARTLKNLDLSRNPLRGLPPELGRLTSLESLDLSWTSLEEIPKAIFRIRSLRRLNFNRVALRQIPPEILDLENLENLALAGARAIRTPPPEVVKQGLEAIKDYWRQRQEAGVDYLCEAKLLIVGEPGSGKTSLAKKIQDSSYQLQPREPSTEGIDILRWQFPTGLRVQEIGKLLERDFRVNIWDFGGQEIYKATHQFFLTRRSLYVLVADDRREDTDFHYWLQAVELLSDGSPVLLVQNEKENRRRELDLARLRGRFPNLKETFRLNLADNRGLAEVRKAIQRYLEDLPLVGTPLPATWKRVREALERDRRNYLGVEEYLEICKREGFKRDKDALQLSGYLHDLGVCLHFQDDPLLRKTVLLKPQWAVDAVYRVLDDEQVQQRQGLFGPDDLARVWHEGEYAPVRDELLRLMQKFQLCYGLATEVSYIAPQLLGAEQPRHGWETRDNVVVRYRYEFMPKGIVTRFIVATHDLIADQELVWRSGSVLERDGTRARVIEDYPGREITVRLVGPDPRSLFAIVDRELEKIHASFPKLQYDRYLPCRCELCRNREDPFVYPLSDLKDFARTGDEIQCRVSRKMVDAGELIRELLPWVLQERQRHVVGFDDREQVAPQPEPEICKEVYVSYAWGGESERIVDELEKALGGGDVTLLRDRNEVSYRDSIREFMQRLGHGKAVIVVLSEKYLRSDNCMFELVEIAEREDVRNRVFPIVLADADLYDSLARVEHIEHWMAKKKQLEKAIRKVGSENLPATREDIDLYARIRSTLDGILGILKDMNALTPETHRGSDFGQLIQAVSARLTE